MSLFDSIKATRDRKHNARPNIGPKPTKATDEAEGIKPTRKGFGKIYIPAKKKNPTLPSFVDPKGLARKDVRWKDD